jgi:hypothetical protein
MTSGMHWEGAHIWGKHLQALEGKGGLGPEGCRCAANDSIVNAPGCNVGHAIVEGHQG